MDKNQNQNDILNLLKGNDLSKLTPAQTNMFLQQLNQKKDSNKLSLNQPLDNGNIMGVTSPLLTGLNPNNNFMSLMNNNALNSINLLNSTNQLNNFNNFLPTSNILNTQIGTSAPLFLNNSLLNSNLLSNNIDPNLLTGLATSTTAGATNKLNNNSLLLNKLNQNIKTTSPILNNSSVLGSTSLPSNNIFPFTSYPLYSTNDLHSVSSTISPSIIPGIKDTAKLTSPSSVSSTPSSSLPATPTAKTVKTTTATTTTVTSAKPTYSYKPAISKPINKKSHIETTYNPTISKNKKRSYSDEKINTHSSSSSSHRTGKYNKKEKSAQKLRNNKILEELKKQMPNSYTSYDSNEKLINAIRNNTFHFPLVVTDKGKNSLDKTKIGDDNQESKTYTIEINKAKDNDKSKSEKIKVITTAPLNKEIKSAKSSASSNNLSALPSSGITNNISLSSSDKSSTYSKQKPNNTNETSSFKPQNNIYLKQQQQQSLPSVNSNKQKDYMIINSNNNKGSNANLNMLNKLNYPLMLNQNLTTKGSSSTTPPSLVGSLIVKIIY